MSYEEIERELNRRLLCECRCDERLKGKGFQSHKICVYLQQIKKSGKHKIVGDKKGLIFIGIKKV